jgi:hypothetical protein
LEIRQTATLSSNLRLARRLQRSSHMKLTTRALFSCALVCGCSHDKPAKEPGPMEKAGAAVDEGAEDAKDSAKEAGKKVGEATEKTGDKLQEKSGD